MASICGAGFWVVSCVMDVRCQCQVCDIVRQGADVFWIKEQQVPFAVLGDQWISFDDDNSLTIKVGAIVLSTVLYKSSFHRAFRFSSSTPGPAVHCWMGDRLWASNPSRYVTNHLGQLTRVVSSGNAWGRRSQSYFDSVGPTAFPGTQ